MEAIQKDRKRFKTIFVVALAAVLTPLLWFIDLKEFRQVEDLVAKYDSTKTAAAKVFDELKRANSLSHPFLFLPGKKILVGSVPHWEGSIMVQDAYQRFEVLALAEEFTQLSLEASIADTSQVELQKIPEQFKKTLDRWVDYVTRLKVAIEKTEDPERSARLKGLLTEARKFFLEVIKSLINRIWDRAITDRVYDTSTIYASIDESLTPNKIKEILSPNIEEIGIPGVGEKREQMEDNEEIGQPGVPKSKDSTNTEMIGQPGGFQSSVIGVIGIGRPWTPLPGFIGKGGLDSLNLQRQCQLKFAHYKDISAAEKPDARKQIELLTQILLECPELSAEEKIRQQLGGIAQRQDYLEAQTIYNNFPHNKGGRFATDYLLNLFQTYLEHCEQRKTAKRSCQYQKQAKDFIDWNNGLARSYFINSVAIEIARNTANSFIQWEIRQREVSDGWSKRTVNYVHYFPIYGSIEINVNAVPAVRVNFSELDANASRKSAYFRVPVEKFLDWKPGDAVSIKVYNEQTEAVRTWRNDEHYSLLNLEDRPVQIYTGDHADVKISLGGLSIPDMRPRYLPAPIAN